MRFRERRRNLDRCLELFFGTIPLFLFVRLNPPIIVTRGEESALDGADNRGPCQNRHPLIAAATMNRVIILPTRVVIAGLLSSGVKIAIIAVCHFYPIA